MFIDAISRLSTLSVEFGVDERTLSGRHANTRALVIVMEETESDIVRFLEGQPFLFAPIERDVILLLLSQAGLVSSAAIARELGLCFNERIRTVLTTLADRKVIDSVSGHGYRLSEVFIEYLDANL